MRAFADDLARADPVCLLYSDARAHAHSIERQAPPWRARSYPRTAITNSQADNNTYLHIVAKFLASRDYHIFFAVKEEDLLPVGRKLVGCSLVLG